MFTSFALSRIALSLFCLKAGKLIMKLPIDADPLLDLVKKGCTSPFEKENFEARKVLNILYK